MKLEKSRFLRSEIAPRFFLVAQSVFGEPSDSNVCKMKFSSREHCVDAQRNCIGCEHVEMDGSLTNGKLAIGMLDDQDESYECNDLDIFKAYDFNNLQIGKYHL